MKYYLVPEFLGSNKYVKIGADGFTPSNSIPIPDNLKDEEQEWLVVTEINDNFNFKKFEIGVNQELKNQILSERQIKKEQYTKIELRTRKRIFGENLIDAISLLNESNEVNLESLEAMIMDPDLMVIRELLWTGSIKSAYQRMMPVEQKISNIFGETSFLSIKLKMEQFLQSIGEL